MHHCFVMENKNFKILIFSMPLDGEKNLHSHRTVLQIPTEN